MLRQYKSIPTSAGSLLAAIILNCCNVSERSLGLRSGLDKVFVIGFNEKGLFSRSQLLLSEKE